MEECLKMFRVIFSRHDSIVNIERFYEVDDNTLFNVVIFMENGCHYINVIALTENHAEYKANRFNSVRGRL
jgi:hypothetical protein